MELKQATERDFIIPEFRDRNPKEYEVRDDGACVRKDRWEMAVQRIRELVGIKHNSEWEIKDVIEAVEKVTNREI